MGRNRRRRRSDDLPWRYDTPTAAKDNVIEGNHVHHVMLRLMDGGGIYTLVGGMPGTVIRDNRVHDATGWPGGICLDEGSADIEVAQDAISRLPAVDDRAGRQGVRHAHFPEQ